MFGHRGRGESGPGTRADRLGGSHEAIVLAAWMLFAQTEPPAEFTSIAIPGGLVVGFEGLAQGGFEIIHLPLARKKPRNRIDPETVDVLDPLTRNPGTRGRGAKEALRFRWNDMTERSAPWEQAYYDEARNGWEVNWVMEFTARPG